MIDLLGLLLAPSAIIVLIMTSTYLISPPHPGGKRDWVASFFFWLWLLGLGAMILAHFQNLPLAAMLCMLLALGFAQAFSLRWGIEMAQRIPLNSAAEIPRRLSRRFWGSLLILWAASLGIGIYGALHTSPRSNEDFLEVARTSLPLVTALESCRLQDGGYPSSLESLSLPTPPKGSPSYPHEGHTWGGWVYYCQIPTEYEIVLKIDRDSRLSGTKRPGQPLLWVHNPGNGQLLHPLPITLPP